MGRSSELMSRHIPRSQDFGRFIRTSGCASRRENRELRFMPLTAGWNSRKSGLYLWAELPSYDPVLCSAHLPATKASEDPAPSRLTARQSSSMCLVKDISPSHPAGISPRGRVVSHTFLSFRVNLAHLGLHEVRHNAPRSK